MQIVKFWDIIQQDAHTFKVENHENKKHAFIETQTSQQRNNAFELLKQIGFNQKERGQIWNEIIKIKRKDEENKLKAGKTTKIQTAAKEFTDFLSMADRFIQIQPLFYNTHKIWWLWNFETFSWEMVDEIDLLNRMDEHTDSIPLFKPQIKNEILNALRMRGRMATPKPAKKTWIQLKNKIYDMEDGRMFEATSKYFVTNPIPWELGETEETPNIDRLFREWVSEEDLPKLYEIMAYAMLPDYPLHRVFCLNGEGRNGKSSFLQVLINLAGEKNTCSTDFMTLVERPFEAAKLFKKLVCIMGEINSGIFKRTSLFKKLTGSDMIGFEFKGIQGFDGFNYAKLFVATNKLPESTDKTVGFYSRWLIVDFDNIFKEKPGLLKCIPDEEYRNLARKGLRILKELLERAEFTGEGDIKKRMDRYEERASPIKDFLNKECEREEFAETPFWQLFKEYEAYLSARNFRMIGKAELSLILRKKGFGSKRVHYTKSDGSDSTMIVIQGICLKEPLTDGEEVQKAELGGLKNSK